MERRLVSIGRLTLAALTVVAVCGVAPPIRAQVNESDVPETAVVPGDAPAAEPAPEKPASAPHAVTAPVKTDVEAARAKLKLVTDTPIYAAPSKSSKQIEKGEAGKFVNVTGSTHYFLQVKLKSGQTGYLDPAAVDLVKPADKIFALTSDAPVLDKPNRWGKKVAEVHKGHDVHVIGVALSYTKIRMKSGLEGFITMTAMQ